MCTYIQLHSACVSSPCSQQACMQSLGLGVRSSRARRHSMLSARRPPLLGLLRAWQVVAVKKLSRVDENIRARFNKASNPLRLAAPATEGSRAAFGARQAVAARTKGILFLCF